MVKGCLWPIDGGAGPPDRQIRRVLACVPWGRSEHSLAHRMSPPFSARLPGPPCCKTNLERFALSTPAKGCVSQVWRGKEPELCSAPSCSRVALRTPMASLKHLLNGPADECAVQRPDPPFSWDNSAGPAFRLGCCASCGNAHADGAK